MLRPDKHNNMIFFVLVSPECLSGHTDQCNDKCDQNLPQFVGSILSSNIVSEKSEDAIGEEKVFVCEQGFIINPQLKLRAVNKVIKMQMC